MPLNCARWMVWSLWLRKAKSGTASPGCGDVVLDGGLVVGAGLGDDDDLVEEYRCRSRRGLLDEEGGGDVVAGVEFGGDGGVLELVGHGHGVHEAGDGLAVERDVRLPRTETTLPRTG